MKQYILALLLTMLCPALFYGQDTYFTYQSGENELRFRLLDDGTVGLVGNPDWRYTGDVVVPPAIQADGKAYRVTATCGGGDDDDPYYEGTDVGFQRKFHRQRGAAQHHSARRAAAYSQLLLLQRAGQGIENTLNG